MAGSKVEVEGLEKAQRFVAMLPREKLQEGKDFLNKYGTKIQGNAMRAAPVGVSGDLKNDVQFQLLERNEELEGQLGFNVFYAKYVHGVEVGGKWIGPRRHFVPFSVAPSLERWARYKGLKVRKGGGLWVGGEDKARPFLYNAAVAEQSNMLRAFKALGGVTIK